MWHLKTRMGTFWIMETEGHKNYCLGIDDYKLGDYQDAEYAARDVFEQNTGYFEWDCQSRVKVPSHVNNWKSGAPENW